MSGAHYQVHGAVAVITLDNPPVNGLGYATRAALAAGVESAVDDPNVHAMVLIGARNLFSGGADIREFNTEKSTAEPTLRNVIRSVEASTKPMVAAIAGVCMGGGLELALGCHFRVAAPGATIALPEVKLGLLPGAGGTQRLPRLIGVEAALNMIVSGTSMRAEQFEGTALFDELVTGDLLEAALAFADRVVAQRRPLRRARDIPIDYPNAEGYFQFARNTVGAKAANFPAPRKCIDAIAAAVALPFEEGLRVERELFQQLLHSPESRALRHAFFGERAAAKIADVPAGTPTRDVASVAVVGAGTMGGGIAMNFLNVGLPVTILEATQAALDKGVGNIRKNYESAVQRRRLTSEQLEQRMRLLTPTLSYDAIKDADLVIEAVFEDMDVKQRVFAQLDAVMKPGAILATNTSTLDVNRIAAGTSRPQDVVGMHFFSPANVMKLLEVVRAGATGNDVLATVMQVAKKIGKTAVVSGVCDGFIGNRMLEQYLRQAMFLLEEGASVEQVDRALEQFGMAMGPFRMGDLAGNDIGWAVRKRRYVEKPHVRYSRIADRLCELGRFGQKTGAGWYRYASGRRDAISDPAVGALLADYRKEQGISARTIGDDEIVARCIFALVNEGARVLADGVAQRASDIDVVYLTGYGFPLHRGGPMLYADMTGLPNVIGSMKRFAADPNADAAFWQPAPLLAKLAAEGKTFTG